MSTNTSLADVRPTPVQRRIPAQYEWIKITDHAPFAARDGAGALVFRNRMWLIGGWNNDDRRNFPRDCVNDVWSSSNGIDWTLEKPNTFGTPAFDPVHDWEGRHTAGYAVHQDAMWIIGGDPLQKHYQDDVWKSTDGRRWHRVSRNAGVPWKPRVLHYTVSHRNRLWVMGGQTMPSFAPGPERFYRDVWVSDDGMDWEQITAKADWPARGMIGGSAVFNGRIWILGGGTYETPASPFRNFYNDVWSSADGIHWNCHTKQAPWQPRQYHDVAVFDDHLWVLEGYNGANRNDAWFSADGTNWQELPDTPWAPRHAASVFVHDNALWMVAGNNMDSDVWKLVRCTAPTMHRS